MIREDITVDDFIDVVEVCEGARAPLCEPVPLGPDIAPLRRAPASISAACTW
jgi:hypothetical protein